MNNYEFKENAPTEVEILSSETVLPKEVANPGNLSKISLPCNDETEEDNFNLTMDKTQQQEGKEKIKFIFENILKRTPIKNNDLNSMTASEKTFIVEKNIVQVAKRDAYINVYVEIQDENCRVAAEDERGIKAVLDKGEKILKMAQIKICAKSIEQNGLVYNLGELINLDEKLSFSMSLPNNVLGGMIAVARVFNGNLEFLPTQDAYYDQEQNKVVFHVNKGGNYMIIQLN